MHDGQDLKHHLGQVCHHLLSQLSGQIDSATISQYLNFVCYAFM